MHHKHSADRGARISSDTGPFAIVPEWVLDLGLSDKAVRLYALLARYADDTNDTARPSRETLARRMACSTKSVDRAVAELCTAGALSVSARYVDGRQTSNHFIVMRADPRGATPMSTRGDTDDAVGGDTHVAPEGDTTVAPGGDTHVAQNENQKNQNQKNEITRFASEVQTLHPDEFDLFWQQYPKRRGKRVGKATTRRLWDKLDADDRALVLVAVGHYAVSKDPMDGFARDPERFLKADWWRDWIEPPDASGTARIQPRAFESIERVLLSGEAS